MTKKILIIGGAGYVGSQVANDLFKKHKNITVIDNFSNGYDFLLHHNIPFYNIDIRNSKKIKLFFQSNQFDEIYHFASLTSVPDSQKYAKKYFLNNVVGTLNILKSIKKNLVKKFIFSSSSAVYGNAKKKFHENDKTLPTNNYGRNKLACEKLIIKYSLMRNFKYAILRYFNVIGSSNDLKTGPVKNRSLFKVLAKNTIQGKFEINVYGKNYQTHDGTGVRDYIDVNDLSKLHIAASKKLKDRKSFVLNCGYENPVSVLEVIKAFELVSKKSIKIKYKNSRPGDIAEISNDNTMIKNFFKNYKNKYSIQQSIKNMISWEKKLNKIKNNFTK